MKFKNKENKNIAIIVSMYLLLLVFLTICAVYIIENDFPSSATNDAWLSYFGSLIGATVGAMVSGVSLVITIRDNQKARHEDEIDKVKPYIFVLKTIIPNKSKPSIKMKNIGNKSAINSRIKIMNGNNPVEINFNFKGNYLSKNTNTINILEVDETVCIEFDMQELITEHRITTFSKFEITYLDILNNEYKQIYHYDIDTGETTCEPPILIKPSNSKHS